MAATSGISEYKISVPQEQLDTLQSKLAVVTLPDEMQNAGWGLGAPLKDIRRLVEHWRSDYDWRKHEDELNKALPQYTTDIDVEGFGNINIHFVHQKSPDVSNAIPLLFCHGWPGSFIEVKKILPELLKGGRDHPAFHVVAPSLPNYGFSEGVTQIGFGPWQCAEVCHKLMQKLGYTTYATQGGDWGWVVTRVMGIRFPDHLAASHVNMAVCKPPAFTSQPLLALQNLTTPFSAADKAGRRRAAWFAAEGSAYYREHATKPQTIGYALNDSPLALLAWIYEKLHDWTDAYPWSNDEVLTWISVYWFSRAGPHAAHRLYYEATHDKREMRSRVDRWVPHVKLGVARFPKELSVPPKLWLKTLGPLVYESEHEQGGHFAAWERPDAIVADLRKMFNKNGGGAYNSVKSGSGYASTSGSARL